MMFEDGSREPLHGHNYRVMVKGETPELNDDMVFDFLNIKPVVREVCDSLDHKLIIPTLNKHLTIKTEGRNTVIITKKDESLFSVPSTDVLLLPILNSSAERFAMYICGEIRRIIFERYGFYFSTLEVEVEETTGQAAVYLHREKV